MDGMVSQRRPSRTRDFDNSGTLVQEYRDSSAIPAFPRGDHDECNARDDRGGTEKRRYGNVLALPDRGLERPHLDSIATPAVGEASKDEREEAGGDEDESKDANDSLRACDVPSSGPDATKVACDRRACRLLPRRACAWTVRLPSPALSFAAHGPSR